MRHAEVPPHHPAALVQTAEVGAAGTAAIPRTLEPTGGAGRRLGLAGLVRACGVEAACCCRCRVLRRGAALIVAAALRTPAAAAKALVDRAIPQAERSGEPGRWRQPGWLDLPRKRLRSLRRSERPRLLRPEVGVERIGHA